MAYSVLEIPLDDELKTKTNPEAKNRLEAYTKVPPTKEEIEMKLRRAEEKREKQKADKIAKIKASYPELVAEVFQKNANSKVNIHDIEAKNSLDQIVKEYDHCEKTSVK